MSPAPPHPSGLRSFSSAVPISRSARLRRHLCSRRLFLPRACFRCDVFPASPFFQSCGPTFLFPSCIPCPRSCRLSRLFSAPAPVRVSLSCLPFINPLGWRAAAEPAPGLEKRFSAPRACAKRQDGGRGKIAPDGLCSPRPRSAPSGLKRNPTYGSHRPARPPGRVFRPRCAPPRRKQVMTRPRGPLPPAPPLPGARRRPLCSPRPSRSPSRRFSPLGVFCVKPGNFPINCRKNGATFGIRPLARQKGAWYDYKGFSIVKFLTHFCPAPPAGAHAIIERTGLRL